VADFFVNKDLNEGEPNDSQSSGQGQSPATRGVYFGFSVLFLACAIWAAIHGLGPDGNVRSWIGFALSALAAVGLFVAGYRTRRTTTR